MRNKAATHRIEEATEPNHALVTNMSVLKEITLATEQTVWEVTNQATVPATRHQIWKRTLQARREVNAE